jgi:hypothetical protein
VFFTFFELDFISWIFRDLYPFRYQLSIAQHFGLEHPIVQVLFDAHLSSSILLLASFFVMAFFFKREFILLFIIGVLVAQGDIHINLATLSVGFIFLGRSLHNFNYLRYLEGHAKLTWKFLSIVTLIAHSIGVYISINFLRYIALNGYFNVSMYANRYEFYVLVVALYYAFELAFLSFWGHFYYIRLVRNIEPTQFLVKYSTVHLINEFPLSNVLKNELRAELELIESQRVKYEISDLDLLPKRIVDLHRKEESFLNLAKSALT